MSLCNVTMATNVRSKFTHMAQESKVGSYLLVAPQPQTLEEVVKGVSSTVNDVESTLFKLLCGSNIVSREVKVEEDTIKLYWRVSDETKSPAPGFKHISHIGAPSRRSRLPFKSPARTAAPVATPTTPLSRPPVSKRIGDAQRLADGVLKLQSKLKEVESEMEGLATDSYCEDELQVHIDKLHEYNEMKDVGQLLLGKIAEVEGTTTAALYEKFGLELDD